MMMTDPNPRQTRHEPSHPFQDPPSRRLTLHLCSTARQESRVLQLAELDIFFIIAAASLHLLLFSSSPTALSYQRQGGVSAERWDAASVKQTDRDVKI
jgi:hypothetical protein